MTPDELLVDVMALCGAERGRIIDRDQGVLAFRGTPTPYFANMPHHEFLKIRKEMEEQGMDVFRSYNEPASLIDERFEDPGDTSPYMAAKFPFAQNTRLLYVGQAPVGRLTKNFGQIKTLISEAESKLMP